jgi:hypothetical protein
MAQALLAILRLGWEGFLSGDKHSSLIGVIISCKEKSFRALA